MPPSFDPRHWYAWLRSLHLGKNATDIRYLLVEACLIGLLSAISALILKQGVGWLGGLRIQLSQQYGAFWVLPLAGLALGGLTGWLIETVSPTASGGGISQVKLALARYPIAMSLRVAIVKLIGTISILGAGMTLGRRAPTVHIGAALAAQLSHWLPTSPEHRRQMIAAGAASGLAAGFGTPIAGVLFVVEELMRDISGLTLETALIASFTGAVTSLFLTFSNPNTPPTLVDFEGISFSGPEIPFFLLLGVVTGILGAIFNHCMIRATQWQGRLKLSLAWRIGLTGLISGSVIALLPPFFRDNTGLREFLVTGELATHQIAIAFIAHFFLTILAYSANAPGGIFAPALVLGSSLGYLVGNLANWVLGLEVQTTFALAGMAAFFTAVVRVPVTAILIVFELHPNFNLVLPLMVTCAIAYGVAESIFRGSLYAHLLEARGIHLEEGGSTSDFLSQLTAADVMQHPVETLDADLDMESVVQALSRSHHRGFPILEGGKLKGILTQSDIAQASQQSGKLSVRDIMTENPITISPAASLSDVLYLLNRYHISRLPVIEGSKLLGIITRSDIIRIEAERLSAREETRAKPSPSYIAYQTRAPTHNRGRILLPIANPYNASSLIQIAGAIARDRQDELECLQVIEVPRHQLPNEAIVSTQDSRKLLQRAERLGRQWQLSVHTQIRIAHDRAEAILDTVRQRQITLLVMGWKGTIGAQNAIFGSVVDNLVRTAPCALLLVKLGTPRQTFPTDLDRNVTWLIPTAGGPNAEAAIALIPALTKLYERPPHLLFCSVSPPQTAPIEDSELEKTIRKLKEEIDSPMTAIPLRSNSVIEAIVRLAQVEQPSAIALGASREGLLQQAIAGNIPSAIARQTNSTVLLFRGPL